jgi:hypothetical protein
MGNHAPRAAPSALPKPMRQPVPKHCMKPSIAKNRLNPGRPCRVTRADASSDLKEFDHGATTLGEPRWYGQTTLPQEIRIE